MTENPDTDKKAADFYKETVFLPKTDFPMRGELPKKEPEILAKWQAMDLYSRLRETAKGRKKFVLHDGPPYANGDIHMGHALNKVLKDVIVRSWQMMGYDSPYVPGWDCHGLPIEWKVEEHYRETKNAFNKDEIDPIAFRADCRAFAQKWVNTQSTQFQSLGIVGDWANPYLTMTYKAEGTIVREIHKFLLTGSLYKGVKPVMWSVVEQTALAEAEVEYKEHKSITIWVKFPIVSGAPEALKDASIVIWTTTPWTMPSNRAIAYGAKMDYAVYEVESAASDARVKTGEKLVLAKALADAVKKQAKIEEWTEIAQLKGADLEGTVCAHPLRGQGYEYDVPLLEGDFVTADAGTGFVHMAPSHGEDDYYLYISHFSIKDIPDNVADDGKFRDHVPLFAGKAVLTDKGEIGDGNFAVIKALDEAGNLLSKGSIKHDYPHSWRSKAPLIFRTTPQWFIALDDDNDLRGTALKAIGDTRWVPGQGENRIRAMIEQRPDWCISRQRAWGVPIALFLDKKDGQPLKDEAVLKRIGDTFEQEGSDAWWQRDAQYFLGDKYSADDYTQVFDIVDVWFESGSTHAFVLEQRPELKWPADLYLEGSDQHRGWFHSSLLESCGTRGRAPFDAVLTHGFVLDEKGYKMSKSLGNVVDPLDMAAQYGADIVRLWALLSDYNEDIRIGKDTIKMTGDLYRRIRNTLRFLLGALDGFTKEEAVQDAAAMPELERLVLHWLAEIDEKIRGHIQNYEFNKIAHLLHNFCAIELSAFYFDIRKDRLYCDRPDLFERRACRTVLNHIFTCLVTWLAPLLAFTTEEAWQFRPMPGHDTDSVHLQSFPALPDSWRDDALSEKWREIRAVRKYVTEHLEAYRANKTIGSSLEAAPHLIFRGGHPKFWATINPKLMAEVCITSDMTFEISDQDVLQQSDDGSIVSVSYNPLEFVFKKAEGRKCLRSWKILPEVGMDKEFPDLTLRDADAVRWHLSKKKAA